MELGKLWEPESNRRACRGAGEIIGKSAIVTFDPLFSNK